MFESSAWVNCLKKPSLPSCDIGDTIRITIQFNHKYSLVCILFLIGVREVQKDALLRNGFNHHWESYATLPTQQIILVEVEVKFQ